MPTYADVGPSGTIYRATESGSYPNIDLLTLLCDSDLTPTTEETQLHISAADPSQFLTKRSARQLTRQTAHAIRTHFGIGQNGPNKDVVTVVSTGHHLLPLLFYGVVAANGIFSAVSAASSSQELARAIVTCESKLLVCNPSCKEVALAAAKLCEFPLEQVVVMGEGERWSLSRIQMPHEDLLSRSELEWNRITDPKLLEENLICLIFSSGTTGLPKGVCLSHANVVAEVVMAIGTTKAAMKRLNPKFEYRTLAHLPTAHIAGIQGYMVNPAYYGGPVYWMSKFSFPEFLEYNKKYEITSFFTVPPIWLLIAKSPLVKDHFATLEVAVSGAAPLSKEIQIAASKKLRGGKTPIQQTWGLSETTGSVTLAPPGYVDLTGSVSGLLPNCLARIVDDDGRDVNVGDLGEVWIKAPVVTRGYYRNDAANAEAFHDGWFCTGDVATFKNGLFYIVDRKKELIKYKGTQVAPAELEALLLAHPNILDAAVIGVPHDEGTNEVPRAYVVADQSKITAEQIEQYIRDNTAAYKHLRGGCFFLDAIPKSPSGKILRKDLRALAARQASTKL